MKLANRKVLVAFFSHKGENYAKGKIIELAKGNTHFAAEMIQRMCNGDLFEIRTVKPYPYAYKACVEVSKEEIKTNARPELYKDIDISSYDVVFIGYPIWCGTMPMPVWTFLENHDFTGKIVIPFCTHEGSKMANSEKDIRKLISNADIKAGLPILGSEVQESEDYIQEWLKQLK